MSYDREVLGEWSRMENWGDHMDRQGLCAEFVPQATFQQAEQGYFAEVQQRIVHCQAILATHPDDPFVHFVVASLYDRLNEDANAENLFKRRVQHHCLEALRIDPTYAPAKKLLTEADAWVQLLGGDADSNAMPAMSVEDHGGRLTIRVRRSGDGVMAAEPHADR